MMKENQDFFIAPTAAAKILHVSLSTLKKFIYTGKIKTLKTPGGHHRILERDLFNMLEVSHKHLEGKVLDDKTFFDIADGLVAAVEKKQKFCHGHAALVAQMSVVVGLDLKFNPFRMRKLHLAALLHDVGMLSLPEEVINKKNDLTQKDHAVLKTHPILSETIVDSIKHFKSVADIVRQHHEYFNGKGYPEGLSGENILEEARIIHVAESFAAMTAPDSYKETLTKEQAFAEIEKNSGASFDPFIAEVFLRTHEA